MIREYHLAMATALLTLALVPNPAASYAHGAKTPPATGIAQAANASIDSTAQPASQHHPAHSKRRAVTTRSDAAGSASAGSSARSSGSAQDQASADAPAAAPAVPPINIVVNGILMPGQDKPPVIRKGFLLVPLKGVLTRMGATVAWQPETQTADIQSGATHLQFVAGSPEARVNGIPQVMDVAPEIVDGTMMVPLRFVTTTLGVSTSWNALTRQITLRSLSSASPGSTSPTRPRPAEPGTQATSMAPAIPPVPGAPTIAVPATGAPGRAEEPSGPPHNTTPATAPPEVPATASVSPAPGPSTQAVVQTPPNGSNTGTSTLPPALPPTVAPPIPGAPTISVGQPPAKPTPASPANEAPPVATPPSPATPATPANEAPPVATPPSPAAPATPAKEAPPVATPPSPAAPATPAKEAPPVATPGVPAIPVSPAPSAPPQPEATTPPLAVLASTEVQGQITDVKRQDGSVTLTLSPEDAQPLHLTLSDKAVILGREVSHLASRQLTPDDISAGDQATLHLDEHGLITQAELTYKTVRDQLQAVAGDQMLLEDGQVFTVAPKATVLLPNGDPGSLALLKRGDLLTLHLAPDTNTVWRVDGRPGGAQAAPLSDVQIQSMSVNRPGPYQAGDPVVVTMKGTQNGTAYFTVSGVDVHQAMQEYQPGVYTGQFVVPPELSIEDAPVVGHLSLNDTNAAPLQSPTLITIDSVPPTVEQMSPAPGSTETNHRAAIYAVLSDHGGTGVDPASVHLRLNGVDLTPQAQATDHFVTCTDVALVDGINQVVVSARDRAGNYVLKAWQFTVTSFDNRIHSATLRADGVKNGKRVTVSMDGVAGGEATFDLGPGRTDLAMKEVHPGHYEGTVTLDHGVTIVAEPAVCHLRFADAQFSELTSNTLTIMDGRPTPPVIDGPVTGSQVHSPVVIFGHAQPGCRVHVKVEYDNSVLGFFGLRGFSSQQDVYADDTGAWRSDPLGLGTAVPNAHHITYRVTCEAVNQAGTKSKSTRITIFRDKK